MEGLKSWALLTNTITGVAFLSFPFIFERTGWQYGLGTLALVALLEFISLEIMAAAWHHSDISASKHVRIIIGGGESGIMRQGTLIWIYDSLVFLSCFGALIPFTMTAADGLQGLFLPAYSQASETWFRAVVVIIFALLQFPLSAFVSFKDQAPTSITSLVILFIILVFSCAHTVYENSDGFVAFSVAPPPLLNNNVVSVSAAALSNFFFAFTCQMNAFEAYSLLRTSSSSSHGKQYVVGIWKTTLVNLFAVLFAALTYGLLGYYVSQDFGEETQTNFLNNYGFNDIFGIILRVMIVLKMFLTYPIIISPIMNSLPRLREAIGKPLLAFILMVPASAVAIFVHDLSIVLGFIGCITEVFISLALPALIMAHIRRLNMREWYGPIAVLLLVLAPFFSLYGIVGLILTLV
jgi:amino acid permease